VVSNERCVLWELDRETFKAICYEAASKAPLPDYEGYTAPGAAASSSQDTAAAGSSQEEENSPRRTTKDSAGSEEEAPMPMPKPKAKPRRAGVSAEAMKGGDENWQAPVYAKTPEERTQLSDIIRTSRDGKLHMLFGTVNNDTFEKIVDAMFIKNMAKGEDVITQGSEGDFFYIVKRGDFDIFVKKGQDPPKKVFQAGVGFAFGELALLYNAPRSATITASDESEVWCLDRTAFRNLVVRSAERRFNEFVAFLNNVDVFAVLSDSEKATLAEVLEEEEFEDDEAILEQGETDDKMFILREGQAVACIGGDQGEIEVLQYKAGDYFGEIALLSGQPRQASVYAIGKTTCMFVTRPTFLRVMGPLTKILERNIDKYAKYQDAITQGAAACDADADAEATPRDAVAEALQRSMSDASKYSTLDKEQEKKQKVIGRKRVRPQENLENVEKKVVSEITADDSAPVGTLADKVAEDFKNLALVSPSDDFIVNGPDIMYMMMFGGVIPSQKFTYDKFVHVRSPSEMVAKGDLDCYSWEGQTKLRAPTDISVICQKGQKSASDPTPNQDNYFIKHLGPVTMYGVCDGHGPFGHLVSLRLVQTIPYFLINNENYGKDWALALKHAFLDAQKDLEVFCKLHKVNIEASGAAGSVMVQEEQTVHIAFIGDARIMLGSWNRRDSRMIFCTKDHKPECPEEKARLEAAGSEVRELDPGNHRIYLPGSNFPGLTMSRAFGDTSCGGVSREPEYHKFLMQPTDQWYAIVASDGIWEFLTGEEVCNLTAKKLRLKGPRETNQFIVSASRKRWAHVCGDYCDDITSIFIQWNSADAAKDSSDNHLLSVKRPEE